MTVIRVIAAAMVAALLGVACGASGGSSSAAPTGLVVDWSAYEVTGAEVDQMGCTDLQKLVFKHRNDTSQDLKVYAQLKLDSCADVPVTDPYHIDEFRIDSIKSDGGKLASLMDQLLPVQGCAFLERAHETYANALYAGVGNEATAGLMYIGAEADARGCTLPEIDLNRAAAAPVVPTTTTIPPTAPPTTIQPPLDWSQFDREYVDGVIAAGDCDAMMQMGLTAYEDLHSGALADYIWAARDAAGC